jgi:Icc-related predicted phosphoesterase
MKLLVLSDLHLEFAPLSIPDTDADVIILAGDINLKTRGLEWAIKTFHDKPVIAVMGNHEYYGEKYPGLVTKGKQLVEGTNIHLLENDHIEIDGVSFFGCTLWTDLKLFGDARLAGYFCQQEMSDFKKIRVEPGYSKLNPVSMTAIHNRSLDWLNDELSASTTKQNVVVTHHAPSARSIAPKLSEELTSAAYASHLDALIGNHNIVIWVHGHVHNSCDYNVGNTRIVCNPRGYSPDWLNPDFDESFIVEI